MLILNDLEGGMGRSHVMIIVSTCHILLCDIAFVQEIESKFLKKIWLPYSENRQ